MTIKPFDRSLMTPANATDVQRFSPQHSQQLSNPTGSLNLRTPSSFIPKVPQTHLKSNLPNQSIDMTNVPSVSNIDVIRAQHLQAANEMNPRLGRYHHTLTNIPNDGNLVEGVNVPGAYHAGSQYLSNSVNEEKNVSKNNSTPSELKYSRNPSNIASGEYMQNGTLQFGSYHRTLANIPNNSTIAEAASVPGALHTPGYGTSNLKKDKNLSNPTPCEMQYSRNPGSIANEEFLHKNTPHLINEPIAGKSKASAEKVGDQIEQNLEFSSDIPSNALLAEQMLSEALLPPSAVHANDIIGSSLDEKGLMYIREKLSDKYSNKNETPMVTRELDHIR